MVLERGPYLRFITFLGAGAEPCLGWGSKFVVSAELGAGLGGVGRWVSEVPGKPWHLHACVWIENSPSPPVLVGDVTQCSKDPCMWGRRNNLVHTDHRQH